MAEWLCTRLLTGDYPRSIRGGPTKERNIMKNITGWLTSSGKFVECSRYSHLSVIMENEDLRKALGTWGEYTNEDLTFCVQETQERIENDEHPEWHIYECMAMDARSEARNKLLDAGFIRVGTLNNTLHFEGRSFALQGGMQAAKDLADSYDMGYQFERQETSC